MLEICEIRDIAGPTKDEDIDEELKQVEAPYKTDDPLLQPSDKNYEPDKIQWLLNSDSKRRPGTTTNG